MRKQRNQEPESSTTLHLWSYAAARKAVPYFRAVVRSLREHWLEAPRARRQIQRLDARPGRPDRQTLMRRAEAARDVDRAHGELEATLDELKVHGDALETRRPLVHDPSAAVPAQGGPLLE